uniref:Glyoxalase domain-containing protein n=1 Tax=Oncorhynchus kisutch TaxID=8019 RepID=A0A8C7LHX7_ONCKI
IVALIRAFKTATFNRDVLKGCKATCKGPYDEKWSKTMVGFGPEVDDFAAELFYSYGVREFCLGNDFIGLTLQLSQAVNNAKRLGWLLTEVGKGLYVTRLSLLPGDQPPNDPVQNVSLAGSDLQESIHCCYSLLGMKVTENSEEKKTVLMGITDTHCKLELHNIVGTVDHVTAFGRIAFSCPREQFADPEALMTKGNHQIFTILVSLDTPGKATVEVVIWADSDAHEISVTPSSNNLVRFFYVFLYYLFYTSIGKTIPYSLVEPSLPRLRQGLDSYGFNSCVCTVMLQVVALWLLSRWERGEPDCVNPSQKEGAEG